MDSIYLQPLFYFAAWGLAIAAFTTLHLRKPNRQSRLEGNYFPASNSDDVIGTILIMPVVGCLVALLTAVISVPDHRYMTDLDKTRIFLNAFLLPSANVIGVLFSRLYASAMQSWATNSASGRRYLAALLEQDIRDFNRDMESKRLADDKEYHALEQKVADIPWQRELKEKAHNLGIRHLKEEIARLRRPNSSVSSTTAEGTDGALGQDNPVTGSHRRDSVNNQRSYDSSPYAGLSTQTPPPAVASDWPSLDSPSDEYHHGSDQPYQMPRVGVRN